MSKKNLLQVIHPNHQSVETGEKDLWQNLGRVDFKAGDILFKEGDPGFFFYIIQEGKVEIFKTENGKEKTLGIIEPGQPIGEFALLTQSSRSASARALTPGFAVEVSEHAYSQLIEELPSWALSVFQSLIRRLKSANDMLSSEDFVASDTDALISSLIKVKDKIRD